MSKFYESYPFMVAALRYNTKYHAQIETNRTSLKHRCSRELKTWRTRWSKRKETSATTKPSATWISTGTIHTKQRVWHYFFNSGKWVFLLAENNGSTGPSGRNCSTQGWCRHTKVQQLGSNGRRRNHWTSGFRKKIMIKDRASRHQKKHSKRYARGGYKKLFGTIDSESDS